MLNSQEGAWPEHLDALSAAPQYHTLLFENEHVRVLIARVPPGERVPLHTHRWPSVAYMQSWSDFVRRDAEGNVSRDSREFAPVLPEAANWAAPFPPHTLENVGSMELRVLMVEMKQAD